MKVFIQKIKGEFANVNLFTAWTGFRELGYETAGFEFAELGELALDRKTIVCGGIPTALRALELLNVPIPQLPSIPAELAHFAGRKIWTMPLAAVRALVDTDEATPLFIKPLPADHKLFNGYVVKEFRDLIYTAAVPAETSVMCSETVEFVTKYRVFVRAGEMIGCKHYKGDFRVLPDFSIVERAIAAFATAPAAYGIDFGVTPDARTLLVEVNDAYSLGSYGLGPVTYAKMIAARWQQLVGGEPLLF